MKNAPAESIDADFRKSLLFGFMLRIVFSCFSGLKVKKQIYIADANRILNFNQQTAELNLL